MNQNDSTFDVKVNIFSTQSISQDALAPLARRSDVYTALLQQLTLNPEHLTELTSPKRGLSSEAVEANQYKSTCGPAEADQIAAELSAAYDLSGVPGFYREDDRWKVNFHWKNHGYLIPVRDVCGQIQGLKIRLNETGDKKARYRWFSSAGKPEGISAEAAFHFAKPADLDPSELAQIFVTEGPLKSDVIAHLTGNAVACLDSAMNGADQFPSWLRAQVGEDVGDAIVCLDAPDYVTNKPVARNTVELIEGLVEQSFMVRLLVWSGEKGFDDVLLAGHTAERTLINGEALEYLRSLHPEIERKKATRPVYDAVLSGDDYIAPWDDYNQRDGREATYGYLETLGLRHLRTSGDFEEWAEPGRHNMSHKRSVSTGSIFTWTTSATILPILDGVVPTVRLPWEAVIVEGRYNGDRSLAGKEMRTAGFGHGVSPELQIQRAKHQQEMQEVARAIRRGNAIAEETVLQATGTDGRAVSVYSATEAEASVTTLPGQPQLALAKEVELEEWTDPSWMTSTTLEPCPVDILPFPFGEFVASRAEQLNVNEAAALLTQLAAIDSIAITTVDDIVVDGTWIEASSMCGLLLMASGEGKDPLVNAFIGPVKELEKRKRKDEAEECVRQTAVRKALELRLEKAQKAFANAQPEDRAAKQHDVETTAVELAEAPTGVPFRLFCSNATPAAFVRDLELSKGRLNLVTTEGGFLQKMANGGSPDLEPFLKLFTGTDIREARMAGDRGADVPRGLSLMAVQTSTFVSVIQQKGGDQFLGTGWVARNLMACPESKIGKRVWKRDQCIGVDDYQIAITWLWNNRHTFPKTFMLEDRAVDWLIAKRNQMEPELGKGGRLEGLAETANKLAGQIARVAMLLHLMDAYKNRDKEIISAIIPLSRLVEAERIVDNLTLHAMKVHGLLTRTGESERVRLLKEYLSAQKRSAVTKRQALRNGPIRGAKLFEEAVMALETMGFLEIRPGTRKNQTEFVLAPGTF